MDIPTSAAVGHPTLNLSRAVISSVLQLVPVAWTRVKSSKVVTVRSREQFIAGLLVEEMRAEAKARRLHIRIEEEIGTRSPGAQEPDGRIDIQIVYSFAQEEYFGIECKRVRARRVTLAKKYVTQGVLRFVNAKYSVGHDWGALVGFAIDGDCAGSAEQVRTQLASSAAARTKREWEAETSFGHFADLFSTEHDQDATGATITLMHMFLSIN